MQERSKNRPDVKTRLQLESTWPQVNRDGKPPRSRIRESWLINPAGEETNAKRKFAKFEKVAVLGAGVMGAGIAAHLANAGIPCLLLDSVPPNLSDEERKDKEMRDGFAAGGLEKALKAKPAAFYDKSRANRIEVGNFEDDFGRISECDWIVEVVVERLDTKRVLFEKVAEYRKPGAIVTSCTSILPIADMTDGFDEEFKQHFLISHFFNPVRYTKLLELVPGPETLPDCVERLADFGGNVLGKGIVYGKATPNLVANRIGIHDIMAAIDEMQKQDLTLEEVDAVLGTPMGRPSLASFGAADLMGVDTFVRESQNTFDHCPNDEDRDVFKPPTWTLDMIEKVQLGNKTKGGFYKRDKVDGRNARYQIDWKTGQYVLTERPKFASVKKARGTDDIGKRIKALLDADDKVSRYAWTVAARTLIYSANRLGEIADDVVNIDNAMKWGFNWDLGPFEVWDAIGVPESVARMKADGYEIPKVVETLLQTPHKSWYIDGEKYFFDIKKRRYVPVPRADTTIKIKWLKDSDNAIFTNAGMTLVDMGDDVAMIEFTTKMNAIDTDIIEGMEKSLELVKDNYKGIVIGNEGANFSVGANLMEIWMSATMKRWAPIEDMVTRFQHVNKALRYAPFPVVAAPHRMALGRGCEVCLPCDVIVANAELYVGLVEVGVGLIPGGGGTKEMVMRMLAGVPKHDECDRFPLLRKAFEAIGMAQVSFSADLARKIGYLRPTDLIQMARDRQFHDAKQVVLHMHEAGYEPPREPDNLVMPGRTGIAAIRDSLNEMKLSGRISEHDVLIGGKLGEVLCGGDVPEGTLLTEDELLELERAAFMSLCGEEKSQARMQAMLTRNRPLRN